MDESGRGPGLECPNCRYLIQLTIPVLLSRRSIYCTSCGLELRTDPEASKNSLQLLADLQDELGAIQGRKAVADRYRQGERSK